MNKTLTCILALIILVSVALWKWSGDKSVAKNSLQRNQSGSDPSVEACSADAKLAARIEENQSGSVPAGQNKLAGAKVQLPSSTEENGTSDRKSDRAVSVQKTKANGLAPGNNSNPAEDAKSAFRSVSGKRLDEDYARFFQIAKVSQAERVNILAILADENERISEVLSSPQNASLTPQQRDDLVKKSHAEAEVELKALLPEETMAQLAEYRASKPQRNLATSAAVLCASEGTTMSAETVDALTKILYQSHVYFYGKVRDVAPEEYKILTRNDSQALSAAASILTPRQLEILKQSLATRLQVRASK